MPTSSPEPTERSGLTDEERFESYVKGTIFTALVRAQRAGWLGRGAGPLRQHHDLNDAAALVLRQLKREGIQLTPAEETRSVL